MAKTQVRADLVLDDLASKTLDKVKQGFTQLGNTADTITSKMAAFASQVAAVAIGVNIGNIAESVKGIATSAFTTALDAEKQLRQLSVSMQMISETRGRAMSSFRAEAEGVYRELTRISAASGIAREELIATFENAARNTVMSRTELTKFMERAAQVSRVSGVSIGELAAGYEQFRKNMVDANNPLVGLIKQANIMRGHSEKIAFRMQMMGRPGILRLAEQAMTTLAERAKNLPMTFSQMRNELDMMKTDTLRAVGEPMVKALTPAFKQFTGFLLQNRKEFERWGRVAGREANQFLTAAIEKAQEGFNYLKTHSGEIKQAIIEAFERARSVWKWIVDNREIIMATLVGAKFAPAIMTYGPRVASGLIALGTTIAQTTVSMSKMGGAAADAAGGVASMAKAGASAAIGLVALAAAVGGVMLAVDQWSKLMRENVPEEAKGLSTGARIATAFNFQRSDQLQDVAARGRALQEAATGKTFVGTGAAADRAINVWQASLTANVDAMGLTVDKVNELAEQARKMQDAIGRAQGNFRAAASSAEGGDADAAATAFAMSFNRIKTTNSEAMYDAAAATIMGSKALQESILKSGEAAGLSLEELADKLGDKLGDFSDKLREAAGESGGKEATKGKGAVPLNVFNGGQVFQIKQDFRDQDPDRIVTVFQRDIARAAENRLQARTALAFGG